MIQTCFGDPLRVVDEIGCKTAKKTALNRGRTDRIISLTHDLDLDLDLQSLRSMVMTYPHTKGQGQRSVDSEDRVWKQTDFQTDGRDCITSHDNAVGKKATSVKEKAIRHTAEAGRKLYGDFNRHCL